ALIDGVFNGNGSQIHYQGTTMTIRRGAAGAVGDCALLCSSPADYSGGQNRRARLPLALRHALADLRNPIQVFNPRGDTYSELIYELLTWMPGVQDDAEGLLYLEPITRTVTAAQNLDRLECNIFRDQPWADRSVISLIRNVFEPIASGDTQIEEELIEMVPR